ncbi:Hsp70 family protein [Megamonas hypermegale]|uniref:Hsp70 family protein n=1 Tax=Megamonas hypermegale TaxID=158847 RepID=UPI003207D73E
MAEITVGIDLGTTNTLACYLKKGKPDLIRFPGSGKLIPSVVYVDEEQNVIVGAKAKKFGMLDPNNEIRSAKTYMGDFSKKWICNGKNFSPTDVAVTVLSEVKKAIVKKMKCDENTQINAVITVPAYFNSNQTDETRKAGERAGFNVMRIVTEPMAAAIAAVKEAELEGKIFIVDLGGGTFDLSVMEADQSTHSYRALDIDGDRHLGGDDFDKKVYDYFISIIEDDLGLDLSDQKKSGLEYNEYHSMVGRVRAAAEQAKIELSDEMETDVNIMNLFNYNGKNYEFNIIFTRDEFDDICKELYDKVISRIKKFIFQNDKFGLKDISKVILVGGSCYIPYIQAEVEKILNMPINKDMDFSTMVAIGAYFVASSEKGGMAINVQDILSHSLGIEIVSKDTNKSILSKLLLKGEAYPCSRSGEYTTVYDNQKVISINIYEAGSDCENIDDIGKHDFYGSFNLDGIEIAPRGVPIIDVTFSYDKSRCLTVKAKDRKTGVEKEIKIEKGTKAVAGKQQNPIDFMLLLDTSGSMYGRALTEAKKACNALLDEMIDFSVHRVGLVTFDSTAHKLSKLSKDKEMLKSYVSDISATGGTNMVSALHLAYDELSNSKNERVVIIVTDGYPDSIAETLNFAAKLKFANMRIIAIGVGSGIKFDFLKHLAGINDAYKLNNMSELRKTFKEVILKVTAK